MNRLVLLTLIVIAVAFFHCGTAAAFGPCCCLCEQDRCQVKVQREETETKVFTCECETICIPPVRFPWENGPLKRCGNVRTVKKLGTEQRKKQVCAYQWSVLHCCPSCRHQIEESNFSTDTATEAAAFAARYPKVSVATIDTIRITQADPDGWVTLTNPASEPLSADNELIEGIAR